MNANEEFFEITDQETGEVWQLKTTSLVADVRDIMLSKRRNQMMSALWKDLTEDQQRDEITASDQFAKDLVRKIVEIISIGNNDVIHALLSQFAIKDGKVKITAEGIADDNALLALNRVGKKALKIIVADHEQFDQERDEILPDLDQPELDIDADVSEDEVEDLGNEMDAELDKMEEPDDLHAAEAETKSKADVETPKDTETDTTAEIPAGMQGQQARLKGDGPDENPFDGGTKDHLLWTKGYDTADTEIKGLIDDGRRAASEGTTKNPWKKGTDGNKFWQEGFNAEKQESAEPAEERATDNYSTGKAAAKPDKAADLV